MSSRSIRLRTLLASLLCLAALAAGCSRQDDAGSGFRLAGDQLVATTTSAAPTTTTPPGSTPAAAATFDIATAKVARVQVYTVRPGSAIGASAPADGAPVAQLAAAGQTYTATPPQHDPIPRVGLNTAPYVEKTATGFAYANPTSFGNPLVFSVTGREGDYVKVLVSARPNHQEGWVKASDVDLSTTQYRLELKLSAFELTAYNGNDVIAKTNVVIGTDRTQTPKGRFFINEKIPQKNPAGAYGPWILSTNGYSEWLDLFDGGLPVVAFHGTNAPGLIGTKASNGCIRMPNDVVTQLATTIPAGTPVDIVD
ncbi:MAG: L,D-transpeptidase [Acidimicrobiales bacterium]